ncbi:hypothetical protein TNCV_2015831 [Trichonephila clavipes]|nr:hypothetical protein TNCV_2015831 [Trichonephila clavipes]
MGQEPPIILDFFIDDNLTYIKVWEKEKLSRLEEALCLLQNSPSEICDVQTDDFSDEEVPAYNPLEFSLDS